MTDKRIVWDDRKNKINQSKHRIGFTEASSVFFDSLALTVNDDEHSWYEYRFVTIGKSKTQRLMVVFFTENDEEIRIISVRKPTRTERLKYEEEH